MKVKIGPYKNWWGPYQLAELLMFWVPKEKDKYGFEHTADRVHKFGEWLAHGSVEPEPTAGDIHKWGDRPHTWLYKFLSWIDSKKKRTIKVHIDRWDTWSMDDTLAHIILPMLKQLKETKHGSPYVENADVPEELQATVHEKLDYHKDGTTDDKFFERWDWVLDEMIFAFETKVDDGRWEEQFETGESDLQWKKLEDGNYQMVEGPNHTRVYDWESRKEYQERISNGFRLFGKYYENLWD
jgi:hypothetical protein